MNSNRFYIPYIDELLVTWYDIPRAHFIKKVGHFDIAILLLSSYVVHIDKTEHWFEKHFLNKFYTKLFNADTAQSALLFVALNLTHNLNLFRLCKELHEISTEKVRLQLLFYFFDLTVSDGNLNDEELKFIELLKESFAISDNNYDAIFSLYAMYNPSFRKKVLQRPDSKLQLSFDVFNLTPNVSFEKVKKKYKYLVKLHHPDKVTHLGETHYNKATEMIKQINKAYSYIKQHFDK